MPILIITSLSEEDRQVVFYHLRRLGYTPSITMRETWADNNALLVQVERKTYMVLPAGKYELRQHADFTQFHYPKDAPALAEALVQDRWDMSPSIDHGREYAMDQLLLATLELDKVGDIVGFIPAYHLSHPELLELSRAFYSKLQMMASSFRLDMSGISVNSFLTPEPDESK